METLFKKDSRNAQNVINSFATGVKVDDYVRFIFTLAMGQLLIFPILFKHLGADIVGEELEP